MQKGVEKHNNQRKEDDTDGDTNGLIQPHMLSSESEDSDYGKWSHAIKHQTRIKAVNKE